MAKTIGERLREAREQKSLSIEDVAHATRIHSNTLQSLEDDDYSGFASTTYAKSFLTLYSRHLEIDASDAIDDFSRSDSTPVVSGANYIRSVAESIEPIERTNHINTSGSFARSDSAPANRQRQTAHPVFLGLFLLILLAIIPLLYFAGKDADSPEDALRNISRMAGREDAGTAGDGNADDDADRQAAMEIDARPGTRISPAAPMTNATNPKPKPVDEFPEQEEVNPVAQTGSPVQKAPIKARPIVAKPVIIPVEGETSNNPDSDTENQDGEPQPETENVDNEGANSGDQPGTATTAFRTSAN